MSAFLKAVTTVFAIVAIHRLLRIHAIHSLFMKCASRTDTRRQTEFKDLKRFYLPSRVHGTPKWPLLVTFRFEEDGSILIEIPVGSYWGTVEICHHTQEMCRALDLISGDWAVSGYIATGPVEGPPEIPNGWQGILMRSGAARIVNQLRRYGSEPARQLDHMIVSAVQDAELYFKLCSTPLWLRILYAATNTMSAQLADILARRILWIQIRTMFYCHDTWEFRGCCMIFRYYYPFLNHPRWVAEFETWSEHFMSRQFLRLNHWVGCTILGMRPDYTEYRLHVYTS